MTPVIDELRGLFIFDGLTDDQLQRLIIGAQIYEYPAGPLCCEGDPAEFFYVLLDGEIALSQRAGTRNIDFWRASSPGSYCGAWSAFLQQEGLTYENTATLTRPSRVLALEATVLGAFLRTEFPMASHLLVGHATGMVNRRRILGPHERLLQLGQLTAGLTHELNNPAAATVRAAAELRARIAGMRQRLAELADGSATPGSVRALVDLQDRMAAAAAQPNTLSPMQKSDIEETLGEWFDDHGVSGAWDHAATFAEAGLNHAWTEQISSMRTHDSSVPLDRAVRWLSCTVETELLLSEIIESTTRIFSLVAQAKHYSQLDRAPFGLIDLHELLDSTLTMMSDRLGPHITIERDFDGDVPHLPCYAAELNQVWTHLINNALDALGSGGGTLTLRTQRRGDMVRVEVCDTGPGISEELLVRIFDPFFTTKPLGEGTGLGLDTAARIIDRHRGSLWAESTPGNTCFIAVLRLTLPSDEKSSALILRPSRT